MQNHNNYVCWDTHNYPMSVMRLSKIWCVKLGPYGELYQHLQRRLSYPSAMAGFCSVFSVQMSCIPRIEGRTAKRGRTAVGRLSNQSTHLPANQSTNIVVIYLVLLSTNSSTNQLQQQTGWSLDCLNGLRGCGFDLFIWLDTIRMFCG